MAHKWIEVKIVNQGVSFNLKKDKNQFLSHFSSGLKCDYWFVFRSSCRSQNVGFFIFGYSRMNLRIVVDEKGPNDNPNNSDDTR